MKQPKLRFGSCAVVGNSGVSLEQLWPGIPGQMAAGCLSVWGRQTVRCAFCFSDSTPPSLPPSLPWASRLPPPPPTPTPPPETMLRSTLAPVIDGHDFVIRINQAPTAGNYAFNTGERTDARFLNRKFTELYAEPKGRSGGSFPWPSSPLCNPNTRGRVSLLNPPSPALA